MHADKIYKILDKLSIATDDLSILNDIQDIRLLVEDMNKEIIHVRRLALWGEDY